MPCDTRRRFLAGLAALAASPCLRAQQPRRTVAFLGFEPASASQPRLRAFQRELAKLGHEVRYDVRSAELRADRLAQLAQAIVDSKPELVLSESALTTLALRQASEAIPIVMAACDDPLASRFVRALEQPGTNATGVSLGMREQLPAPVELLELMMPKGATFGGIFNPASSMYRKWRAGLHYGAVQRKLGIAYYDATDAPALDAAFAAARREKVAGIAVMYDALFVAERRRIVKLALAAKVPVVFPERSFVEAGGLVSHGPSLTRAFTLAAAHADRILKGEPPSAIAVQPIGKYETVVSRKAPQPVIQRADALL